MMEGQGPIEAVDGPFSGLRQGSGALRTPPFTRRPSGVRPLLVVSLYGERQAFALGRLCETQATHTHVIPEGRRPVRDPFSQRSLTGEGTSDRIPLRRPAEEPGPIGPNLTAETCG
jgi:hypothetical protein